MHILCTTLRCFLLALRGFDSLLQLERNAAPLRVRAAAIRGTAFPPSPIKFIMSRSLSTPHDFSALSNEWATHLRLPRPVNPSGALPVLTEEQLWKGLEYKLRNPTAFVAMLSASKTIVDNGLWGLTLSRRRARGLRAAVLTRLERMYMEMSTGLRITNIVSYGAEDELLLTYSFGNGLPGVPADKPRPSAKELNRDAIIGKAMDKGIKTFRELAKEGKL
ncbi:hypothetical protein B0H16DRAFT_1477999 [Mycena metata]|uniref:Uncharacterized protein n=1 Tax=Mycena metata TaxID=1033252 RepID=A0AAD7H8I6_9AGAR|nr:hypothetical protein B0H16DRAFT_1477999 [Mycena metata]